MKVVRRTFWLMKVVRRTFWLMKVVRRTFWLMKVVPTWKKFEKRWSSQLVLSFDMSDKVEQNLELVVSTETLPALVSEIKHVVVLSSWVKISFPDKIFLATAGLPHCNMPWRRAVQSYKNNTVSSVTVNKTRPCRAASKLTTPSADWCRELRGFDSNRFVTLSLMQLLYATNAVGKIRLCHQKL